MSAGLLSNSTYNNGNKVPGLGNIPILGGLFKSRQFQRNESELVIVGTPYLVKPVNAQSIRLPTDGFRNATEAQGLLMPQERDGVRGARRHEPTVAPAAPAGPQLGPATSSAPAGDSGTQTANAHDPNQHGH